MPIKMPKTLDVPDIEKIEDIEDVKTFLREFTEILSMAYEHSESDVLVVDAGDIAYLGDSETDGSIRFIKTADYICEIQTRVSGTWQTLGEWKWI